MHNGNGSEVEYGGQAAAELGESTAVPKRPCPDDDDEECAGAGRGCPTMHAVLIAGARAEEACPSVRWFGHCTRRRRVRHT
mgnify:CR=1 FL=1